MRLHWMKKVVDDIENKKILHCYEIKKKMSECIEENEGDIKNCNDLRKQFEDCLHIFEKRINIPKQNTNIDLAGLYN